MARSGIAQERADWPADSVERRPTAKLVPYARNARTHSDEQITQIASSIREWGWTTPVLLDEQDGIIAGHGRVLAAKKLGIADIPCMVARGWSEAHRKAYVLADNKLTLNGGWDDAALKVELGDLKAMDFDLSLTGFSLGEVAALMAEESTQRGGAQSGAGSLAARFMVVPFSVLNAREGWWQDRKRAWLALGIQSELGRGDTAVNSPHEGHGMADGLVAVRAKQKASRVETNPGGGGKNSAHRKFSRAVAERNARRLADAVR